jgi:hypothetical protein
LGHVERMPEKIHLRNELKNIKERKISFGKSRR